MIEIESLFGVSFWFLVKLLIIICLLFYLVFALVVVRQVKLMTRTLDVGFETQIKLVAYIHFTSALAVFLLALFL